MTNKAQTVTFCITGALDKMRRVDAIQLVQNETNARWISTVSKNTDFLVSKRNDTRKASNARKYGTKVIYERTKKGTSIGRRPITSSMNKNKRRQSGAKKYRGQGR